MFNSRAHTRPTTQLDEIKRQQVGANSLSKPIRLKIHMVQLAFSSRTFVVDINETREIQWSTTSSRKPMAAKEKRAPKSESKKTQRPMKLLKESATRPLVPTKKPTDREVVVRRRMRFFVVVHLFFFCSAVQRQRPFEPELRVHVEGRLVVEVVRPRTQRHLLDRSARPHGQTR